MHRRPQRRRLTSSQKASRRGNAVSCSSSDCPRAADRQFTAKKAAKELQAYQRGRLGPTTRRLRDALVDAGLNRGSLLDIGAGIGALTFELLDGGMTRATVAEAASAYVEALEAEAARRDRTASVRIVHGDLLNRSEDLPSATVVTLDRVICCYPFYEPMLAEAARHAERGLALSYPRDRWYVRAAMWLENVKRARTSGFRTFVHPPHRMQQIIQRAGFELVSRRATAKWAIDVFVRR